MDAKKERSLSRIREEVALYEPVAQLLEVEPGEMGHLQLPIMKSILEQHGKTIECVENDLPFLASQFTNPVEILTAMDVHWYFHIQQLFAASGSGGTPHHMEDLEGADQLNVPRDCCTLIRLALYLQVAGLLPIPTAYLGLTEPCDSVAGLQAAFMHHPDWRNVPVFEPDPPYLNDARGIDYYADQMKEMVEFVTRHTGKTLDMGRLTEVVEETNRCYALWMEYNEIRRSVPRSTPTRAVEVSLQESPWTAPFCRSIKQPTRPTTEPPALPPMAYRRLRCRRPLWGCCRTFLDTRQPV